jgi:hypothetical protein
MDAMVDGLEKAPGSFLEEGKNFGETLVKAATQGSDGLGSAGIFSKRSTAPPRSVMNSRRCGVPAHEVSCTPWEMEKCLIQIVCFFFA